MCRWRRSRRAVERGDPVGAIFESVLMPDRAERTVSLQDIEDAGGLPVEQARVLIEATGLPGPRTDEPCMTPEEATVFERIPEFAGVWPASLQLQVMRVYGRLLGRIAQAETQAFRLYAEPALREASDPAEALAQIKSAFEGLLPMSDPLITGIHRRWVEHELGQAAVERCRAAHRHARPARLGRRDLRLRRPQGLHPVLELCRAMRPRWRRSSASPTRSRERAGLTAA